VNSVLRQDASGFDFEVIVVNDSGEKLPQQEWQSSRCVSVINTNRRERSVARNAGAAVATGDYLQFLDDDDILLPGALERFFEASQRREACWIYGGYRTVDNSGHLIHEWRPAIEEAVFGLLIAGESIPLQASVVRSREFFSVGGFNAHPSIVGVEDRDLGRRLALICGLVRADGIVAEIRIGQAGSATNWDTIAESDRLGRENALCLDGALAAIEKSARSGYWRGRVARAYLGSLAVNVARKRYLVAASRGAAALRLAYRCVLSPAMWRGLKGRRMKIGLDARLLTQPQHGGFKTYTECLVRDILSVDPVNEYIVYTDRPEVCSDLPARKRFRCRAVRSQVPLLRTALREQIGMRRAVAADGVDLVHYLCNTAPVGARTPFVVTIHDVIQLAAGRHGHRAAALSRWRQAGIEAYSRWSIRNVAQRARRVITVSNFEKEQIVRELALPPSRVCVTHLGPRAAFQPPTAELKQRWRAEASAEYRLPHRFILGVGHEPRKNVPLLMEAFAIAAAARADVDLVVVAAAPGARSDFIQRARDLKIASRVKILSDVPRDLMPRLYSLAEMLVYPSEREGFGLPPLEAMACGTPTISMGLSSIPEVVGDGGLLLDSREPEVWAAAILQLLSDSRLRESVIARGFRRAGAFSWRRCALETVAVYQAVAQELKTSVEAAPSTVGQGSCGCCRP
jgi:glycosyltransferase involved in cell wall biosynthesis